MQSGINLSIFTEEQVEKFREADKLHWEIMKFLWSCPNTGKEHPYRLKHLRAVQENIVEAVATGQYIILRDEAGEIEHFISYWKVSEEDIESIRNGIKPADRREGDKLYICECGNKGGRKSFTRMITEIKKAATGNKGFLWHNWNRQTFRVFLNKKGVQQWHG